MLKIGDKAPEFTGKDQDGNIISLNDFKGEKLVLYFYPKDNTPGCTAEACNLRDNYHKFLSAGYNIVGVSKDPEKSHKLFKEKHSLPFTLISDSDLSILKAYESWGKKKFLGREFEGVLRRTFVIDENGLISDIIDKVNTADHSSQILK